MARKFVLALLATFAATLPLGGCDIASFNASLITTTQNLVALNNAIVQINLSIINDLIAQQKLLAPYECGAYALANAIIADSNSAAKVNSYLAKNVALGITNVAVRDICVTLGYPTNVLAAPGTPAVVSQ